MRINPYSLSLALVLCWATGAWAIDPYAGNDPYWILLHEPAVIEELKLSPEQKASYRDRLDQLDLQFLALRNKPQQEAQAGAAAIISEARTFMNSHLGAAKSNRLSEILLQRNGTQSLLGEEVAKELRQTDQQRKRIAEIVEETRVAVAEVEKDLNAGKPREPLEKRFAELKKDEHKKVRIYWNPISERLGRRDFLAGNTGRRFQELNMSEEAVERLKEAVESAALAMLRESAAGIAFEVDFVSDQAEPIVANRVRSLQDGDPDLPPSAELKHPPATVSPPSG